MSNKEKATQDTIPSHHNLADIIDAARDAWTRGNNAGRGSDASEFVHVPKGDDVDVYYIIGAKQYIAVADFHGPRAVDITDDLIERGVITVITEPLTEQEKQENLLSQYVINTVAGIQECLWEAGIEIDATKRLGTGFGVIRVSGTMINIHLGEVEHGTCKLQIRIPSGPAHRAYKQTEGKHGFNYAKLAEAVKSRVEQEAQRKVQAKKEHEDAVMDRSIAAVDMRNGNLTEKEHAAAITAILEVRKRN